jgi:hypothetical protein
VSDEPNPPPELRPNERNPWDIWLGVAIGLAPALVGALFNPANLSILLLAVSVSLWPLAAVVLAIIRTTRRFGLGMLLGVGLGWLAILAICGGLLRR